MILNEYTISNGISPGKYFLAFVNTELSTGSLEVFQHNKFNINCPVACINLEKVADGRQ